MSVLIITDVYGDTPAIASLTRQLPAPCHIITPDIDNAPFTRGQQAYQSFVAAGGVAAYADKIAQFLHNSAQQTTPTHHPIQHVIAFSAGASAWWLQSAHLPIPIHSATLFYASRVRDHAELPSACPTHFIFAEHEDAFHPAPLVQQLRQQGHQAEIAPATQHGFMNPYAAGFSLKMQTRYIAMLVEKLRHKRVA